MTGGYVDGDQHAHYILLFAPPLPKCTSMPSPPPTKLVHITPPSSLRSHCPPPCPGRTDNTISKRDVILLKPQTKRISCSRRHCTPAGSSDDRREHMSSPSPITSKRPVLEQISPHYLAKQRGNHDPRPRRHTSQAVTPPLVQ